MAESQDVNTLKRRGRRRLVGAIALVLLATIILPMVFDSEPRQATPPVSVRIPGEDESPFTPKTAPVSRPATVTASPSPTASAAQAPAKTAAQSPVTPAAQPPAAQPDAKSAAPVAAPERAAAPAGAGEQYVVPVAALASAEKVNELTARLTAAKLPYYTEALATVKGPVTRVRAGPFASKAAAEQAQGQLKRLGLKPGNVVVKP